MRPALTYVTDDHKRAIGFLMVRGRSGIEAFDRDENSLGLFDSPADAARAVVAAAINETGAG
jgi:hypothetical protein